MGAGLLEGIEAQWEPPAALDRENYPERLQLVEFGVRSDAILLGDSRSGVALDASAVGPAFNISNLLIAPPAAREFAVLRPAEHEEVGEAIGWVRHCSNRSAPARCRSASLLRRDRHPRGANASPQPPPP